MTAVVVSAMLAALIALAAAVRRRARKPPWPDETWMRDL